MKPDKETQDRLRLEKSHNDLWAYFEENLKYLEEDVRNMSRFFGTPTIRTALDFFISLLYARREEARQLESSDELHGSD